MNLESINIPNPLILEILADPLAVKSLFPEDAFKKDEEVVIPRMRFRPGRNVEISCLAGRNSKLPWSIPLQPENRILTILLPFDGYKEIRRFPEDRKLNGLETFIDLDSIRHRLATGLGIDSDQTEVSLLQYVAARSCSLLITSSARTCIAKAYSPGLAAAAWEMHNHVYRHDRADLKVAEPLFCSENEIWQEALPGVPLDQAGSSLAKGLWLAAVSLAALHSLPTGDLRSLESSVQKLEDAKQLFVAGMPGLAARVIELVEVLKTRRPALHTGFVHGDLHLGNLIFDGQRAGIIDLDNAGVGDCLSDLGSLAASLYYRELSGQLFSASSLVEGFVDAYQGEIGRKIDVAALNWHIAAALVCERAARCITRLKLRPGGIVSALLDAAERHLSR